LIQIKVASDTSSSVDAGSGTDAANDPAITSKTRFSMSAAGEDRSGRPRRRRMEIFAFLFLTAVLLPGFAVATVGSYGLAVWVDAPDAGSLGTILNQLALLPDVYSASLVFHAVEATT